MSLKELFNIMNLECLNDDIMFMLLKDKQEELIKSVPELKSNMTFYYFCMNLLKFKYTESLDFLIEILPKNTFTDINNEKNYFFTNSSTANFFDCETFEKYASIFQIDIRNSLNNFIQSESAENSVNFWNNLKSSPSFIEKYIKNYNRFFESYILKSNFNNKDIFKIHKKSKLKQEALASIIEMVQLNREDIKSVYTELYIKGLIDEHTFQFIKGKTGFSDFPNLEEQKELLYLLDREVLTNPPHIKEIVMLKKIKEDSLKNLKNSSLSLLYFNLIFKHGIADKKEEAKEILLNDANLLRRYYRDQNLLESMKEEEFNTKISKLSVLLMEISKNAKIDPLSFLNSIKQIKNSDYFLRNYEVKLLKSFIKDEPEILINKKRL